MKETLAGLILLGLTVTAVRAEEPLTQPFPSYKAFMQELESRAGLTDAGDRERALDELWRRLEALGQIPFRHGDRVAFLFRDREGEAIEVAWRGDMTDWQLPGSHVGRRLGESDVWLLEDVLPSDARVDYKLFLNQKQWRLDLANPRQQVGGYGPNSELRMPDYRPPPEIVEREGVARGTLGERRIVTSSTIDGYRVAFRVYTPAGYADSGRVPVAYFTDGQDYSHPEMGRVTTVLDNAIADGALPPLIAVFVDPRDPQTEDNRRQTEYADRPAPYARFLAEELVPEIDSKYRTQAEPAGRVVVGTSFGGLFATHVAFHHSAVFGGALIQSPAFEYDVHAHGDRLRKAYRAGESRPVRLFIDVGTLFDQLAYTRDFRDTLRRKGWTLRYVEVNEGHSWGHWRAWIDDGLAYLLAP